MVTWGRLKTKEVSSSESVSNFREGNAYSLTRIVPVHGPKYCSVQSVGGQSSSLCGGTTFGASTPARPLISSSTMPLGFKQFPEPFAFYWRGLFWRAFSTV